VKLTPSLFPSLRRTRLLDEVGAPARNANERLAADVRGQELLRSWLSPEQRRQYDQRGSFEVVGSDTGKRYRICKGDIFNVQESDDRGVQVRARCVTANGVPIGDINLAQKIALETFESDVLRIANRTSVTIWHSAQPALGRSSLRLVDRDLTELCPWLRRCLSIIADPITFIRECRRSPHADPDCDGSHRRYMPPVRHRNRCLAGGGARRTRTGHPHDRGGHQAVPLRGPATASSPCGAKHH
jgi:hypothetical protein